MLHGGEIDDENVLEQASSLIDAREPRPAVAERMKLWVEYFIGAMRDLPAGLRLDSRFVSLKIIEESLPNLIVPQYLKRFLLDTYCG